MDGKRGISAPVKSEIKSRRRRVESASYQAFRPHPDGIRDVFLKQLGCSC